MSDEQRNEQRLRLVELSRVDIELAALLREKAAFPTQRVACKEEWEVCQQAVAAAKELIGDAEQLQRRAESDLADHEALLNKLTGQQHQVKTNEAYTALLGEMEQARQAISAAETRILEAMEGLEAAKVELAQLEKQASGTRGRLDGRESAIEEREKAVDQSTALLNARREEISAGVDRQWLDRYKRIADRRSPAVAIVSQELCLGCRVGIPPQLYIEILRGDELVTCQSCQRIVVHEDQLGGRAVS